MWSVIESTMMGSKQKEIDVVEATDYASALQTWADQEDIVVDGVNHYYLENNTKIVDKSTYKMYCVREIR
jgi:hypothetical protein